MFDKDQLPQEEQDLSKSKEIKIAARKLSRCLVGGVRGHRRNGPFRYFFTAAASSLFGANCYRFSEIRVEPVQVDLFKNRVTADC